jgi:hypothetical protein
LDEPRGLDISKGWSANSPCFYLPLNAEQDTFADVEEFLLLKGYPRDAEQQIDHKLDSIITHIEQAQKANMEGSNGIYVTPTSLLMDSWDPPHLRMRDFPLKADVNPKV